MRVRHTFVLSLALVAGSASAALAQTGVSDDRVSLPEGPGSLEGIGDDIAVNPNMGALSYAVPLDIPAGFPGMTPEIGLSYSSSGGQSPVGMGWSMPMMSLERLTLRGVPEYVPNDEFEVDSGEQLVLVDDRGNEREYRARFEGGFARYTWKALGDGSEGWWQVEWPDGRVGFYGADSQGNQVADARLGGADGTGRWLLTEIVDVWGHRIAYSYGSYGSTRLIDRVEWVFTEGQARYRVDYTWEARNDFVSNATLGFEEVLEHRLAGMSVHNQGVQIRRYALNYEDEATSGGFTRLASVDRFGLGDVQYPASFSFGYSRALGEICAPGGGCDEPFVVDMGTAVGIGTGDATLIDMDGDALPDIVDSTLAGAGHRIFRNELLADGTHRWAMSVDSAVGDQNGHDFSDPTVQVLDANGDGFTDVLRTTTGEVLINRGNGDWDEVQSLFAANSGPDFAADFDISDGQLGTIRFFDYDNDGKIDLIRSQGTGAANVTTIFRNTGNGFQLDPNVDALGVGFDADTVELNDINGDGLLDAVQVEQTQVRYRLNLGWGKWAEWRTAAGSLNFSAQEAIDAELEDVNGDGISDLVLVTGDQIRLWINRNGEAFDPEVTLTSADVAGTIPTRTATTQVLFADMNGNGSSDVVWIENSGQTRYLELFPVRPNLLAEIRNGLGWVQQVEYATSVEQAAEDAAAGNPWPYALPFPNIVVDRTLDYDELTPSVVRITEYDYADGFYDGVEKQFRGYENVATILVGDATQEDGRIEQRYLLGETDPYFAGKLAEERRFSAGRAIKEMASEYVECPLDDVPTGLSPFPVRWICPSATETVIQEGTSASEWATTRTEYQYDGSGNQTLESRLGVIESGGQGCAPCQNPGEFGEPCGTMCLGDEAYTETDYVDPADNQDGRWLLGLQYRQRSYGVPGSDTYAETLTYYDGESFVGLPLGQATTGSAARMTARETTAGDLITATRLANDEHGNTIEAIEANGEIGSTQNHRQWTYDASGLFTERVDIFEENAAGPYTLSQIYTYSPLWDLPETSSNFFVVRDGTPSSVVHFDHYAYDEHGRVSAIANAPDTPASPTWTHEWTIREGGSSVTVTGWDGTEVLSEIVNCFDGRGRTVQRRMRVDAETVQVSGFTEFNAQGGEIAAYVPWLATDLGCESNPPPGTARLTTRYDAEGRPIEWTRPSSDGGTAVRTMSYGVLEMVDQSWSDNESGEPWANTPVVRRTNGQGTVLAVGRVLTPGAEPDWYTVGYDEIYRVARLSDPLGNAITQVHDQLGRVVQVDHPDTGTTTFAYDGEGQIVSETDANGTTVVRTFDGVGRVLSVGLEGETPYWTHVYDEPDVACPDGMCANVAGRMVATRYDLDGQPATDWASYDEGGTQTAFLRHFGETSLAMAYTFDNIGRLRQVELPGGRTIDMTVDDLGRAVAFDGLVTDITYDARGQATSLALANGVGHATVRDALGDAVQVTVTGSGGESILDHGYRWSDDRWLIGVDDLAPLAGAPTADAVLAYDGYGRLTRADLGMTDVETLSYTWDLAENLIDRSSSIGESSPVHDGARPLVSGRPHQLAEAGGEPLAYDAAGYVVGRGDTTVVWDGLGRIRSTMTGADTETHVYAGQSERVASLSLASMTIWVGEDVTVEDGLATYHLAAGDGVEVELEYPDLAVDIYGDPAPISAAGDPVGDNLLTAGDAWLAYASEQGFVTADTRYGTDRMLAAAAALNRNGRSERRWYHHRDPSDHVIAVTDADGELVERTHRFPFGKVRWSTGEAQVRRSFSGADVEDGVAWIGERHYATDLARWLAPDPGFRTIDVDAAQDRPWEAMGTYQYGWNTPLSGRDVTGLAWSATQRSGFTSIVTSLPKLWGEPSTTLDTIYRGQGATGRFVTVLDGASYMNLDAKFNPGDWGILTDLVMVDTLLRQETTEARALMAESDVPLTDEQRANIETFLFDDGARALLAEKAIEIARTTRDMADSSDAGVEAAVAAFRRDFGVPAPKTSRFKLPKLKRPKFSKPKRPKFKRPKFKNPFKKSGG